MRYISTFTNSTLMIGVASEPGREAQPRRLDQGEKPLRPGLGGQRNTDDYVAFEMRIIDEGDDLTVPVVAVAAGSQTQGRDERPSQVVIEAIYTLLRAEKTLAIAPLLVEALHAANEMLYQQTVLDPTLTGKGATALVAAIVRDTLHLAYVGDCRLYLLRDGTVHRLTLPAHRLPAPESNRPLDALLASPILGCAEFIEVATAIAPPDQRPPGPDAIPPSATVTTLRLAATDTLIFCTPGLYQVIPDQELAQVAAALPAQAAAWRLADLAAAAETNESNTVLIVQPTAAQPGMATTMGRATPRRRTRRLRRALLMAACLLLLLLSGATLVERGGQLAGLVGARISQSIFMALAQERTPRVVADPEVTNVDAMRIHGVELKREMPLLTPSLPLVAPVTNAPTVDIEVKVAADPRPAASVAAAAQPAPVVGVVLSQQLAQLVGSTTQNSFANLRKTIGVLGAAVAAGRTATAVVVAALPTPTPTLTPTPLPPTPTPRPRVVSVAATPAANTAPDFRKASVTLLEPIAPDTLADKRAFRWQANFTLPVGYAFEVVFWQRGQDPMRHGRGYAGLSAQPSINVGYEHFRLRAAPEGEYYWGVLLVTKEPYQRIKFLGGGALIYVKQ